MDTVDLGLGIFVAQDFLAQARRYLADAVRQDNRYSQRQFISAADDYICAAIAAWNRRAPQAAGPQAALKDAVLAYNEVLRSAAAIAERQGKSTNWEPFAKRVLEVLKEHHQTFAFVYRERNDTTLLAGVEAPQAARAAGVSTDTEEVK